MIQKITIIGAGVIGASIAYYLSRGGANVTVLEKNHVAAEASGSSFGWLNANFPESEDYFKLRQASLNEYPNLLDQLSIDVDAQFNGCLFWELQAEQLQNHFNGLKSLGYSVELVDPVEFKQLEPSMSNFPELAMKAKSEGAVDPEKLAQVLLKKSKAKVIEHCEIIGFVQKGSQVVGVKTNKSEYFADTVVIAAGIFAGELLRKLDVNLPMNNRKGFIIKTQPTSRFINRVLFGPDIHFKQQDDGTVVIGDWLHDIEGDVNLEQIAQRTMNRFVSYFPSQENLEIDRITCAYRPMPEDGYSVIGTPKNWQRIYLASTHSGVTLAPIIGKLASQEILNNKKSNLLNKFRIERFH